MTGKYCLFLVLLSFAVAVNHLTVADVAGFSKATKCLELLKKAASCAKDKGMPDIFDVVGHGLSLQKNKLQDNMKCDLFHCILPLRDECSEGFSRVSKLLEDHNVDTCSGNSLLISLGGIVLSVLIGYLV